MISGQTEYVVCLSLQISEIENNVALLFGDCWDAMNCPIAKVYTLLVYTVSIGQVGRQV